MPVIEADLAIVGCGAMGASAAYHATRQGQRVVMIDRFGPAGGSSGWCNGSIVSATKTPGLMMDLTIASKALFPEMVADLGVDVGYSVGGGLMLCETKDIADGAAGHAAAVRDSGTEIEYLDGPRLREMEPALSPHIHGAYYVPSEGVVYPPTWTKALASAAIARGARALWGAVPRGFDLDGARIRAMDTAAGTVRAETYLIAAGAWSEALGAQVGLKLPVMPRRGELVITARGHAHTRRKLISAGYLTVKRDAEAVKRAEDPAIRLGYGFSLGTTSHGQTIMGSTRGFVGYDARSTGEGVSTILREAIRRIPALASATILRAFAAFRPYVPDGRPIVGRGKLVENLLIAAGHEGDGICLSAITGRIMADLAAGKDSGFDLSTLSPDRFARAS